MSMIADSDFQFVHRTPKSVQFLFTSFSRCRPISATRFRPLTSASVLWATPVQPRGTGRQQTHDLIVALPFRNIQSFLFALPFRKVEGCKTWEPRRDVQTDTSSAQPWHRISQNGDVVCQKLCKFFTLTLELQGTLAEARKKHEIQ